MVNITKQQLDARWDAIPVNLREILCSPEQGKIIWDIGKNNHLVDEKIGRIMKLTSYVIMGFIHLEDLPKEIKEMLNINPEIANAIYREIEKKIFAPIRSEIDKVYAPVAVDLSGKAQKEIKEENIIDLKTFQKQGEIKEKEAIVEKPVEVKKELPAVPLPGEIVAERAEEIPRPSASVPGSSATGETEVEPIGPVIIHKEIETKPTLGKQRSLGGLFGFLRTQKEGEKIQEQKPITAEVEIPSLDADLRGTNAEQRGKIQTEPVVPKPFGAAQGKPPVVSKVEPPKVVHYSDLKTPLSADLRGLNADLRGKEKIKMLEMPMPLVSKPFSMTQQEKPETKSGSAPGVRPSSAEGLTTSKVFESEIEKARKSGMILNGSEIPRSSASIPRESAISEGEAELMVPIEIEEVPRQNFFSKIFQSFIGLFVTKKKIIKAVSLDADLRGTNAEQRGKGDQSEELLRLSASIPRGSVTGEGKAEPVVPMPPQVNKQPTTYNLQPTTHNQELTNEEVIDLRTFQRVTHNPQPTTNNKDG